MELLQRGAAASALAAASPVLDADDVEDLEDAPEDEVEAAEEEVVDQATAARTIAGAEGRDRDPRRGCEALAPAVRRSGEDTKWRELASLLGEIFTPAAIADGVAEEPVPATATAAIPRPTPSPRQKLVIFTEHRDTLNYLADRIAHAARAAGGGGRRSTAAWAARSAARRRRRSRTTRRCRSCVATDAAGEGINLQRAHLMVNYDLPWNPNRIEQRFGRIHRIGQTEVCHLWNLVAEETREGDVYRTLLEKLEEARKALGGQVFDVLGKLQFEGKPLRDLLIEAIRYGDQPEVRARLTQAVDNAVDRDAARRTCSRSARWPTTRWTRAASRASARRWSAPRPAGCSRTTSSPSSSRPSSGSAARSASASRAATRSPMSRRRSATATG